MCTTCTLCVHVIKHKTKYFISALIITVICNNDVKVVIMSERLITCNDIFIKNDLIELSSLSQNCFKII